MKKYNVLCHYCGRRFKVLKWWWFLKFLILGEKRYVQCPYCKKVSRYQLVCYTPHDVPGSNEREQHKQLEETWKRG